MDIIKPDNKNFQYTGRIDFTNPAAPTLIYAGSMIKTRFQGTSVKLLAKNYHACYENSIGYIIDGQIGKVVFKGEKNKEKFTLAEKLDNKVHDLIIYKRQDAANYFDFLGLILDKHCRILAPEPKSNRRIECFGDSVSAGEVCEALDNVARVDPENHEGMYSNSWYSYSMITARNLNAEINNNAQGGMAVLDGTGYFAPDYGYLGLESTYDKLRYSPQLGEVTPWDFSKYIPQVVIMALGQNDNYPSDYINEDEDKREAWINRYKEIIFDLKSKYPGAMLDDENIVRFRFRRNGIATPGHPRIPEQEEMARELTEFIKAQPINW